MAKTTTWVLAGLAVATLAAADVAAVIRYRQGHEPSPEEHAHLDELDTRLYEALEGDGSATPSWAARVVDQLQRSQDISVARRLTELGHGACRA
jgi:hypothetical protein